MASQKYSFHRGTILNPRSDERCDFLPDGVLVLKHKRSGTVIHEVLPFERAERKYEGMLTAKTLTTHRDSLLLPGLFDMHFHWVQDDVRQMPKDSLLEWLEKYTFPAEMKFASRAYTRQKARLFFQKLARTGTLGGACYSSIHEHAVEEALAQVKGDFVIGNVLMNMNSPEKLTRKDSESLDLTRRLVAKFGRRYVFTPRFAITTSPEVMRKGAKLADKAKCFKQTHLSETPAEIDFVLSLYRKLPGFEDVKSYTEIYQRTGMLGKRSLMGHGIHLSDNELRILRKTDTVLVHCPTSNAPIKEQGLGSGLFDFHRVEKARVRWVLGSDIGGGPFLSMFDVMQSYVEQNARRKVKGATYVKALYRSTLASAEVMGTHKRNGNFKAGKEANFIVVPFKGRATDAESALKKLLAPLRKQRSGYEKLVKKVYHLGKALS